MCWTINLVSKKKNDLAAFLRLKNQQMKKLHKANIGLHTYFSTAPYIHTMSCPYRVRLKKGYSEKKAGWKLGCLEKIGRWKNPIKQILRSILTLPIYTLCHVPRGLLSKQANFEKRLLENKADSDWIKGPRVKKWI